MAFSFSSFFFTLLVLVTVVPAILVVLTLNIVRAACWLLLSLTGAAGLFFYLGADFVGAAQLLIYVGGTLVLVIFGVMLTATGPFVNLSARSGDWAIASLTGFAFFGMLAYGLMFVEDTVRVVTPAVSERSSGQETRAPATTNRIGLAFLGITTEPQSAVPAPKTVKDPIPRHVSGYLLPFEIISVHLVVVLIGAAYLARAKRRAAAEESHVP